MKLKFFIFCVSFLVVIGAAFAAQEEAQPLQPDPNPVMDKYLNAIETDARVQAMVAKYGNADFAKTRFKDHMEVVRISSPSRQELYRAIEITNRLKALGYGSDAGYEIVFNPSGNMPGAALQIVDGRPVYQACAVVKGSTPDSVVDNVNIFSRPKVVIEGHIDSVNPGSIEMTDLTGKTIPAHVYDKVRVAPAADPLVSSPAELASLKETLNFDANNKLIEDEIFAKVYKRFDNIDDAKANGGYRIYIPGYSDAMNNTMSVYQMAKLIKEQKIKPVHDVWFCFTSGEEGRGNLAGMKQLYGYNQDAKTNTLAEKGKNKLNVVANLSIDGGFLSIHYLGSYRYEVNYNSSNLAANTAMAAARSIAAIADLKSPSEQDPAKPKTTYTVGIVYPTDGSDGSKSTSFEVDMRSPVPETLEEIRNSILPLFPKGAADENAKAKVNAVVQSIKWFGDRPAHRRSPALMRTDPLIYAGWKTYGMANGKYRDLDQYPKASTSLNDNVPAAIGVPSVNMNMGVTAAGGGGHSFNEWGIPGKIEKETANFKRVLYTLLAVAGMNAQDGKVVVPAAYPNKAPRHVNETWE